MPLDNEHIDGGGEPQPNDEVRFTVAVCTRDRPENLASCLTSLAAIVSPEVELLVVDNAPTGTATRQLLEERFPSVRYAVEPRPGLDWARNQAIADARGEIIAFIDDDATAEAGWLEAIGAAFEDPAVMAVTGLTLPAELETDAQRLFESYGGFGKGTVRKRYQAAPGSKEHIGSGVYGTGTNMAFRRSVFTEIGGFDPALDLGTVTHGGGDSEMFFRILQEGHTLVYEPAAVVKHRHRRGYGELRTQMLYNGIGFYSYLFRTALVYPSQRWNVAKGALYWLIRWDLWRLLRSFVKPGEFPRDLILAELKGHLVGLTRYPKARREAKRLEVNPSASTPPPSPPP